MKPTPTKNSSLAYRTVGCASVAEGLDYAAQGETGCNFYGNRGVLAHVVPYAEIRRRALAVAAHLAGLGLPRGSRIAIVAETDPYFLVFFYACQYAGLVPVPMPISINFGGRDSYVGRLRGMLRVSEARLAIGSEDLIASLREAAFGVEHCIVGTPDEIMALPEAGAPLQPLGADEECYIQFSSGSTRDPKGVVVTQRALIANATGIVRDGVELTADDRCVSWLPLYHDMGLVGCCLSPMLCQTTVDFIPTTVFARRPFLWLQILSDNRGTISFSPTFGYELCLRRANNRGMNGFDLSSWRVAGIGAEMIRPEVLRQFATHFGGFGFDGRAFLPSYGLAESTLAVSFAPLGEGVRVDRVDRQHQARHGVALPPKMNGHSRPEDVRSFAICGRVLPGHQLEVRDDQDRRVGDRVIGRICIAGPSLMAGYLRNTEASGATLQADGWLDTGDLGYLIDGELVVTGRRKDLIVHNGRNIWPQDLEWAVESLDVVRAGDVAAFSVDDGEQESVIVVVECGLMDTAARDCLRREVAGLVQSAAGIECEVILVPRSTLTFTSSGKLSRAAVKADYLAGAFDAGPSTPPRRLTPVETGAEVSVGSD
ncbi:fatty acyl-AMP ligase [Oceanibacterium hippocampi]|nr:fatty acyl-AMP ligase [Oceanibacterium hippocampi]